METDIKNKITKGFAIALFASARITLDEEEGISNSQQEILNLILTPEQAIPDAAWKCAEKTIRKIEKNNGIISIEKIYENVLKLPGKHEVEPKPELFGYYLGMEALGHGVNWSDDHPEHKLNIPNIEFIAYRDNNKDIVYWYDKLLFLN